ncbi:MAG TPA: 50S ribosomal protein L23 [Candidatus Paceibacterota bacterium]
MALFGQKTKVNDSSAEKAQSTKDKSSKKALIKKTPVKAEKLPKAEKVAEAKTKEKNKSEKRAEAAAGVSFPKGSAVIKPRVTEKSGLLSQKGIYTFDVRVDANTRQIAAAIVAAYKVTPVKVSIAPVPAKAMFVRGKSGSTSAGKKAYVYLKKGDTIEFI